MIERKKKLLSVLLASSIVFTITGCGTKINKSLDNSNRVIYTGKVNNNNLDKYFIIELINLNNETKLYLTNKQYINGLSYGPSYEQYEIVGTNINLTTSLDKYYSDYGKIVNIVPFSQFISIYSEIKDEYSAEEILGIFECVKEDYDKLIKKVNIKKLELKK